MASSTTSVTSGFVVTVQFGIAPEHMDAFMQVMVANARSSREREPGCLAFDVCVDPAQPAQVFLNEAELADNGFTVADVARFVAALTKADTLRSNSRKCASRLCCSKAAASR